LVVSPDGKSATLHVKNAAVIDSFQFFGPNPVPATVSFNIKWVATGKTTHFVPGSSDPTDPTNFDGHFYKHVVATGRLSGKELGFSFKSDLTTSEGAFAELGTERNGAFLP
jgi:hypothetical protein